LTSASKKKNIVQQARKEEEPRRSKKGVATDTRKRKSYALQRQAFLAAKEKSGGCKTRKSSEVTNAGYPPTHLNRNTSGRNRPTRSLVKKNQRIGERERIVKEMIPPKRKQQWAYGTVKHSQARADEREKMSVNVEIPD